jgi:hypothetical protein
MFEAGGKAEGFKFPEGYHLDYARGAYKVAYYFNSRKN